MESLFTRLYKYRQRENKSDLENFSTELLAYCLESDLNFQRSFFGLIDCQDQEIKSISTQQSDPNFGRPDIEIVTENSIILIENKIEASEGHQQLNRYINILRQNNKDRYLVYLTKFYECKEIIDESIKFKNIKWWDIKNRVVKDNSPITTIFVDYLTENNIAMDKDFKNIDLVSLENITNVISKMDEVIDSVKDYFSKKLGNFSKDSSRSTRLKDQAYFNYKSVGNPVKFNIDLGYFWWWPNLPIYFGIRVYFKTDEREDIISFFKENLCDWEMEPWGRSLTFGSYLQMNEVISKEEDQLPSMINFLKKNIDVLYNLKKLKPEIFE